MARDPSGKVGREKAALQIGAVGRKMTAIEETRACLSVAAPRAVLAAASLRHAAAAAMRRRRRRAPRRRCRTGRRPSPRRPTVNVAENAAARSTPRPPPTRTATRSPSRCGRRRPGPVPDHAPPAHCRSRPPPDFENPTDADGNNVYLVQLGGQRRHDQRGPRPLRSPSPMPDPTASASPRRHRLRPAAVPGRACPTASGRVFVVEQGGRIRILNPASGAIAATPFLDISRRDFDRRRARPARLRDRARFRRDRHLLRLSHQPRRRHRDAPLPHLRRQSRPGRSRPPPTSSSPSRIPASAIIMAAGSASGRTNLLYIGVGRRRRRRRPARQWPEHATRCSARCCGSIPRATASPPIRCATMRFPRAIRSRGGGGRPEIWALGLRNPFRNSFDFATGNLFIGDVGQNAVEEIDLMRPDRRRRQFRLGVPRGHARVQGGGPASPGPAGDRICAWRRAAAGQFGDRRLCLSRAGRIAARPIYLRRFRQRQYLVGAGRPARARHDPAELGLHPAHATASRPMPARSAISPASGSTRRAISTSSIMTARSSGSRRPEA